MLPRAKRIANYVLGRLTQVSLLYDQGKKEVYPPSLTHALIGSHPRS